MEFTENFQLPCPSDTDYGAIALLMQSMAFSVEDLLLTQQSRFEAFNEQPTAIWIRNTDTGSISTSGSTELTWSASSSTVFRNFTSVNTTFFGGVPTQGIYHVGWFANTTCVGAATNDTFRQIIFNVEHIIPSGTEIVASFNRRVQEESVAGGNFFGCSGLVLINSDFANYRFRATFTHGNSGSDMLVEQGATAWFTRVSLNEVIEVTS